MSMMKRIEYLSRMAMRKLAAIRAIQEDRIQSICSQGNHIGVFPANAIPDGWREIDRMQPDCPEAQALACA